MAITRNELENMEQLAYLDIESTDSSKLAEDVSAIMDFVDQLKQIDTTGVTPLFHPLDLHQRLRDDEVKESDCSEELAKIAPSFEDHLYLVPKVLDVGQ
ncbi:glutamyl/tRNA (Gln) amidotransferase subunit C [Legionella lansingensis]|uniref:Aspartyl/glutamyl-tRNA(Asn/Gln) amidotransferase subunit C n=1 Tax=Legionella lansingensis TaxID=45067 RepID=A0A0W0VGT0_9GAMM|nr:Asp-tRNA(Asn)/Glu-tRNA(Gln) amidotransferase subunit GatC [Legionella lansingensis]KTD19311.1 glutamyl/tRNA (Gln) amidotransferase subunit C [Legionella lansingensis]SNV50433.1 glutamyl/tRNA (Gln) amidotransferase subunit C [Legionella lansingensis]